MATLTARGILNNLIRQADKVRAEFSYTDDIHRNTDLQVNVALVSLTDFLAMEIEKLDSYYDEDECGEMPMVCKNDIINIIKKIMEKEEII